MCGTCLPDAGAFGAFMSDIISVIRRDPPLSAAAVIALVGAATIGGFFFFQYVLGYPPCPLCYEQRHPYYFSVPLAILLWLGAQYGASRKVMMLGFIAIALVMLYGMGLAIFHAGVEWKWWQGPQDCSGAVSAIGSTDNLLRSLQSIRIVRCDEAAWRFLGLSLAGYNVLVSLFLAAVAGWGFKSALARRDADNSAEQA